MITKTEAGYTDHPSGVGLERCAFCSMFRGQVTPGGSCTLVTGKISFKGWCTRFRSLLLRGPE